MQSRGLSTGINATAKTLLTGYACCAKNIGIDILNDDCSIDTQTYHAVKKEERIRQAARIKPGWNASRLLHARRLDNFELSETVKESLKRMGCTELTSLQSEGVQNHVGDRMASVYNVTGKVVTAEDHNQYKDKNMQHPALADILCTAETGAGKTLSYGIPLVEYLRTRRGVRDMQVRRETAQPYALILAPTHELAIEILETMLGLYLV